MECGAVLMERVSQGMGWLRSVGTIPYELFIVIIRSLALSLTLALSLSRSVDYIFFLSLDRARYEVATVSRIDKIIDIFCTISSL